MRESYCTELALHGRDCLSDTSKVVFDTVGMRISQLKAIWEHILTPCVDVNAVTPLYNVTANVGSPGF